MQINLLLVYIFLIFMGFGGAFVIMDNKLPWWVRCPHGSLTPGGLGGFIIQPPRVLPPPVPCRVRSQGGIQKGLVSSGLVTVFRAVFYGDST